MAGVRILLRILEIDKESAQEIGLLPSVPLKHIKTIVNPSGEGGKMPLFSR